MNKPEISNAIEKARQMLQLSTELVMVLSRIGHSGKSTAEKIKSKSRMLLKQLKPNEPRSTQHRPGD